MIIDSDFRAESRRTFDDTRVGIMPLVCHPETLGLSAVSAVPGMKPLVTGAMLSGDGRVRRIVRMIEIKKGEGENKKKDQKSRVAYLELNEETQAL